MEKKRVLILSAPFGAGHGSAAQAIAEVFVKKYSNIDVKVVDVMDFAFKIFKESVPKAYFLMSSKIPLLYKWIYSFHKKVSRHKFLNKISDTMLKGSEFADFIKNYNPDFIVSTNPLPMHLVSMTKEENLINVPSANVCTDFGFHAFWYNSDVNYYFVAIDGIKRRFIKKGVNKDSIIVTGIPIKDKFKEGCNKSEIISKLGFSENIPVLLIVGGKMSYEKLYKVFDNLKGKNIQFIIVAGRDEKLYAQLQESELKNNSAVRIFGFIDNLNEFMSISDLILTKAGGVTVAECFAKGLPMVINDMVPGQEEDNVKYVVANKAGFECKNQKKCSKIILDLFMGKKLNELKENCKKLSKPNAAEGIVNFIISKL
jgi:processive 1,2-diacylglycerol beta-glucosyltransferase